MVVVVVAKVLFAPSDRDVKVGGVCVGAGRGEWERECGWELEGEGENLALYLGVRGDGDCRGVGAAESDILVCLMFRFSKTRVHAKILGGDGSWLSRAKASVSKIEATSGRQEEDRVLVRWSPSAVSPPKS